MSDDLRAAIFPPPLSLSRSLSPPSSASSSSSSSSYSLPRLHPPSTLFVRRGAVPVGQGCAFLSKRFPALPLPRAFRFLPLVGRFSCVRVFFSRSAGKFAGREIPAASKASRGKRGFRLIKTMVVRRLDFARGRDRESSRSVGERAASSYLDKRRYS